MALLKRALFLSLFFTATVLVGQSDGDVLFTVDDKPVTVGEFRYIYGKTSGEAPKYDEASVMEYLDLYQRFKLKVARAYEMGLDTVQSLQQELEGYRRQLADNYLVDKQVTDRLVEELYARQQKDVAFSHILFRFTGNPGPADTLALYNKALEVKQGLKASNFAAAAQTYSDDKYSKDKGGNIGYITAPFPNGLHALEGALYSAPVNQVVGPVRTSLGYHLAVKTAERPARGEMEIGHILIRRPEGTAKGTMPVPKQIRSAQEALAAGRSFEEVAKMVSEDKKTNRNGGYLGFFGINKYEKDFEDAAFALTADDQVSDVVESNVGWHLIRRISRRPVQPLETVRPLLQQKVKANGRFADAQAAMIRNLRTKAGLQEDKNLLGRYAATLVDSTFLSFRWKPEGKPEQGTLLALGDDYKYGLEQFQEFLRQNGRKRVSLGRGSNSATVVMRLYDQWVDERLMAYAEGRLEEDFPEFAALMREYREGILLFEATKLEVWDKAGEDTTGLQQFFAANRSEYQYPERATVVELTLKNDAGLDAKSVADFAATKGVDKALDHYGRADISDQTMTYELERLPELGLKPQVGSISEIMDDKRSGETKFSVVTEVLQPRQKELNEARGYVIADFQDQLEREWVARLRQEHEVKVNNKVLKKLIRE